MRLPDLVIALGATESNAVPLASVDIGRIFAAAAFTGVVTIQLSPDDGTTWYAGPALGAGVMVTIEFLLATHVRLSSTLAEAAARVNPFHAGGPNSV